MDAAVTDVLVQYIGLILGENTNCVNTGIYTVGEREVNNTTLASERYCRLCQILDQCIKTGTLTASQQQNTELFL